MGLVKKARANHGSPVRARNAWKKKNMRKSIVAVYKAEECPPILNPAVRARMIAAAEDWDCDCGAYWVSNAGTPLELVVECPPSLLDQSDKLIRRVDAAMRGLK